MNRNTISIRLANLDKQGYLDGRYFGVNHVQDGVLQRLYVVTSADGSVRYVRAASRAAAKAVAAA